MARARSKESPSAMEEKEPVEVETLAAGLLLANAKLESLHQYLLNELRSVIREEIQAQLEPVLSQLNDTNQAHEEMLRQCMEETIRKVEAKLQQCLASIPSAVEEIKGSVSTLEQVLNRCQKDITAVNGLQSSNHSEIVGKIDEVLNKLGVLSDLVELLKKFVKALEHMHGLDKLTDIYSVVVSLSGKVDKNRWSHENHLSQIEKKIENLAEYIVLPKAADGKK